MRTLYFDCFAGASGNMLLGALIASGIDSGELKVQLDKLGLPELELKVEKVDRSGISSLHVKVEVPDQKNHRHLPEIERMITGSTLSEGVKERAIAIFRRLAAAEASVHGIEVAKVHFHEVGALDAIVDIVGSCIGFEILGIERFVCSKIHVGGGFVEMAHGKFPVPPPAVAELLKNSPLYSTEIEGELITPTGAAIISTVCDSYGIIPEMKLERTGYGAGTREYEKFPNVLRLLIGETAECAERERGEMVSVLETNIDDLSPQIIGHLMDRAFETGALDCWFTPIHMKKNRPATLVSVLCSVADENKFLDLLYRETSTIGVRIKRIERHSLERTSGTISTEYGEIAVKTSYLGGEPVNSRPEFEDIKAAAAASGVPVKVVAEAAENAKGGTKS